MEAAAILEIIANGGWGVAALSMYALYMKDKQLQKIVEDRHAEFTTVLKETVAALTQVSDAIRRCKKSGGEQNGV